MFRNIKKKCFKNVMFYVLYWKLLEQKWLTSNEIVQMSKKYSVLRRARSKTLGSRILHFRSYSSARSVLNGKYNRNACGLLQLFISNETPRDDRYNLVIRTDVVLCIEIKMSYLKRLLKTKSRQMVLRFFTILMFE